MNKLVIDANVIVELVRESLLNKDPVVNSLMNKIENSYIITFDDKGFVETECIQTYNPGDYSRVWISEKEKKGKIIRLCPNDLDKGLTKCICNDKGMPHKDLTYIKLGNSIARKYIISEDMDLYDPKFKRADSKTMEKIKNKRCGALCRYLRKTLDLTIANIYNANNEL